MSGPEPRGPRPSPPSPPSQEPSAPPVPSGSRNPLAAGLRGGILALLAGALVLVFTFEEGTWEELSRLDLGVAATLFGLIVCAWIAAGSRLVVLSRAAGHPLAWRRGIVISLASELGVTATPAGLGGPALRIGLLARDGMTVGRASAVVGLDASFDFLVFVLLTPFALGSLRRAGLLARLRSQGEAVEALLPWLGVAFALLVALVLVLRVPTVRRRWVRRIGQGRLRRWRRRLALWWGRTRKSLYELLRLRKRYLLACLALAFLQLGCRYGLLPLLLWFLDVPVQPLVLFYLQGLLFVGGLAVTVPGGGGAVELGAAVILGLFVPRKLLGAVVLLWRLYTYHLYLLAGAITLGLTAGRRGFDQLEGKGPPMGGVEEPSGPGSA